MGIIIANSISTMTNMTQSQKFSEQNLPNGSNNYNSTTASSNNMPHVDYNNMIACWPNNTYYPVAELQYTYKTKSWKAPEGWSFMIMTPEGALSSVSQEIVFTNASK